MGGQPRVERALLRLADLGRVIVFDKRGNGSSHPLYARGEAQVNSLIEQAAQDLLVVLDEVDSEVASLVGADLGAWPAMLLAATHPERVGSLVVQDTTARILREPEYPFGMPEHALHRVVASIRESWGTGQSAVAYSPSLARDRSSSSGGAGSNGCRYRRSGWRWPGRTWRTSTCAVSSGASAYRRSSWSTRRLDGFAPSTVAISPIASPAPSS